MNISIELILGSIALVLFVLSIKEYLSNGHRFTPKIKAWTRVSAVFCGVIIFNLLMTKT